VRTRDLLGLRLILAFAVVPTALVCVFVAQVCQHFSNLFTCCLRGTIMNGDLTCLSPADVRLKKFIEMEIDLRVQFLELLQLRERVRHAEQTRARRRAAVVIDAAA
jgi:hypothetical protein